MVNQSKQIQIFKSLFKGREDVFAVRWEKGNKSGYMPAYQYDPYSYKIHKMKGGNFQNYANKDYLPLTDEQIEKHLEGQQLIGLYPLLKDNTSWFIVADFDKEKWIDECKAVINACKEKNILAYLERSRSGQGGHVWIFFEKPYPAFRSRKIFIKILEQTGIFSVFDKSSSFDRLFPNQDFLSGKGFGNLIALPFYKPTLEQGNSCFINPETQQPFNDQWEYINKINRVSLNTLDILFESLFDTRDQIHSLNKPLKIENNKLLITLDNVVHINRSAMPNQLINFLKEELNFTNSEFLIKKKIGRNTWGTERYFKFVDETENEVIIPRGFIGRLIRFCRENKIEYDFIDERKKLKEVLFSFNAQLREYQNTTIATVSKKDLGVIVAPPGSGKTIIGLKIISDKKQPSLIVTHRKQIVEQWIERIEAFLGIPKNEIGKIGQGKTKIGKQVTVATFQSLSKELEKTDSNDIQNSFGTILIDECHHVPAETFRNTISKLPTFYLYGLTATPFRKYNDGKLIFIHLGEIIYELKPSEMGNLQTVKVIIRNTELDIPFNSKTDEFETLSKILVHDSARNKLIIEDVKKELKEGKRVVIITERKEHIETLNQYLKQAFETISLCGDDSENNRKLKWKILKDGNYQLLITTGQYFGEGTDLQNAQCLFLVYPFSFEGKLIQYIGRVQRSEITPIIYDYRDIKIDYLNKLFLKRNTYYRKIEKHATLFDEPIDEKIASVNIYTLEKKISIPIEELKFGYGIVLFDYKINDLNLQLDFEIENVEIRPEFEVLKPYFSKVLKSKNVKIDIHVEFENGKLVSQLAISKDIIKINSEVVESVKFRFVTKNILGKLQSVDSKANLLDINEIQNNESNQNLVYKKGEDLLDDVLKFKNSKHDKQLRYLAKNHNREILKIRFVLNPFSFVFLLTGKEQYHIVLETLDTEEATYIWHFNKDKQELKSNLKIIDNHLTIIKNKGRQYYLENNPENFSRIQHDYSDDKKGFVIWKGLLEEKLV
jgi:superfamily II DNA or RNA helicase